VNFENMTVTSSRGQRRLVRSGGFPGAGRFLETAPPTSSAAAFWDEYAWGKQRDCREHVAVLRHGVVGGANGVVPFTFRFFQWPVGSNVASVFGSNFRDEDIDLLRLRLPVFPEFQVLDVDVLDGKGRVFETRVVHAVPLSETKVATSRHHHNERNQARLLGAGHFGRVFLRADTRVVLAEILSAGERRTKVVTRRVSDFADHDFQIVQQDARFECDSQFASLISRAIRRPAMMRYPKHASFVAQRLLLDKALARPTPSHFPFLRRSQGEDHAPTPNTNNRFLVVLRLTPTFLDTIARFSAGSAYVAAAPLEQDAFFAASGRGLASSRNTDLLFTGNRLQVPRTTPNHHHTLPL